MNCQIKQLHPHDWALWKEIRLEALKLYTFGSSYEEESLKTDEDFKQDLITSDILGSFIKNKLVGVVGFQQLKPLKQKHRGILFGLYVKRESQGQGIADKLIKAIIDHARQRVLQLHCIVLPDNNKAIKLYQNNGFQLYGTAPQSIKVGDKFYDEHLMVLKFT